MLAESLLLFITAMMSLNQSAEISKKQQVDTRQLTEIRYFNEPTSNAVLRGGWDGN